MTYSIREQAKERAELYHRMLDRWNKPHEIVEEDNAYKLIIQGKVYLTWKYRSKENDIIMTNKHERNKYE